MANTNRNPGTPERQSRAGVRQSTLNPDALPFVPVSGTNLNSTVSRENERTGNVKGTNFGRNPSSGVSRRENEMAGNIQGTVQRQLTHVNRAEEPNVSRGPLSTGIPRICIVDDYALNPSNVTQRTLSSEELEPITRVQEPGETSTDHPNTNLHERRRDDAEQLEFQGNSRFPDGNSSAKDDLSEPFDEVDALSSCSGIDGEEAVIVDQQAESSSLSDDWQMP